MKARPVWKEAWKWPWDGPLKRIRRYPLRGLERIADRYDRGKVWFHRGEGLPPGESSRVNTA